MQLSGRASRDPHVSLDPRTHRRRVMRRKWRVAGVDMEALSGREEIVEEWADAKIRAIAAARPTDIRPLDVGVGTFGRGRAQMIEEICHSLSQGGHHSAQLDDGVLRIRNSETESEYILEAFEQSAQIRQAIWFDCHEFTDDDLNRVYMLCSMMNSRFSGCKCYIDQWGVLTTAADILGPKIEIEFVEIVLGQVEFISLAMLSLVETMRLEARLITQDEIDSALDVPPLQ